MKEFGEAAGLALLVLVGGFFLYYDETMDRLGFTLPKKGACESPLLDPRGDGGVGEEPPSKKAPSEEPKLEGRYQVPDYFGNDE